VDSVRGAKGGYHLAREPHVITVKDVIEASEHVTFEVNCDLHPVDPQRCSPEAACSIRPVWRMLEQRINDLLAGISLADLTHDEPDCTTSPGRWRELVPHPNCFFSPETDYAVGFNLIGGKRGIRASEVLVSTEWVRGT